MSGIVSKSVSNDQPGCSAVEKPARACGATDKVVIEIMC